MDGEQFHETWERLRDLLQQCPHHQVPDWQLVQTFYYGLTEPHRQMVDSSCGGTFMSKNDVEAWQLFENLSDNSLHHASAARQVQQLVVGAPKRGGIYEVGQNLELAQQVEALSRKMDQLLATGHAPTQQDQPQFHEACVICASPTHDLSECPSASQFSGVSPRACECGSRILQPG